MSVLPAVAPRRKRGTIQIRMHSDMSFIVRHTSTTKPRTDFVLSHSFRTRAAAEKIACRWIHKTGMGEFLDCDNNDNHWNLREDLGEFDERQLWSRSIDKWNEVMDGVSRVEIIASEPTRPSPTRSKVDPRNGLPYPFEVEVGRRGGKSRVVLVRSKAAMDRMMRKIIDDGDFIKGYRPAE